MGFNLNLLECKYHIYYIPKFGKCQVLISTYWNVNAAVVLYKHNKAQVLISTYWNVNENQTA